MIVSIKLSEILDAYSASENNFICNLIWEVFLHKYDLDIEVQGGFREQWYSKVLNRPDFYSFYIEDWNRYTQYSVELFVAETGIEYGRNKMEVTGLREYRIWVMRRAIATVGDVEFVFSSRS